MNTFLDCFSCFFRQALQAARLAGADEETQRKILNDVALALPDFSLQTSPPEMARTIHTIVQKHVQVDDPYLYIKEQSNKLASSVYDRLLALLDKSSDRLLTAVELAIAGNVIDYGAKNSLNVAEELEKILTGEFLLPKTKVSHFFQYEAFTTALAKTKTILYLADNAGEILFDRLLMEEIKKLDPAKEIIVAVKDKPAINDALLQDAIDCGVDKVAEIISSGSDAPGTLLDLCFEPFLKVFHEADMVISKGQGNYESLSGVQRPMFYLLLAKCPVIAEHIGCRVGDVILLHQNNANE